MKSLIYLFLLTVNAYAGFEHAPPAFKYDGTKAVFVDFIHAQYNIVYNVKKEEAFVESVITFEMPETGYPIFDLVNTPLTVKVNEKNSSHELINVPGNVSRVRVAKTQVTKGQHKLIITSNIVNGTLFKTKQTSSNWGNVSSGFFIRDLKDRMFLEKYVPTNYEYDQYKMDMDVKVLGTKRWHSLFVNGKKTKITENHYKVSFPEWYCASSVYFHLVPINRFVRWYLSYPSIDGRKIPVTIYSNYRFYNHYVKRKAWNVLAELEADYGPFPHDQLVIYGTGVRGGMEHAGATETSIVSLGHELQHQYFAKAIHPANGNSGWLDEAIASWRDKGHQTHDRPFYESVNLAKHNQYTRKTDKRSYKYGRSFMAYIDYQLKNAGHKGLKDFLKIYFAKRKYTNVTTEIFKHDLEEYAQMTFGEDFFQYIYGGYAAKENTNKHFSENPHHPQLTQEELNSRI